MICTILDQHCSRLFVTSSKVQTVLFSIIDKKKCLQQKQLDWYHGNKLQIVHQKSMHFELSVKLYDKDF